MGSKTPLPARPAYAAVKAALNALSRQAAVEYGRHGIRSNTILAGDIGGDDPVKQRLSEHAVAGPALLAAGCSPRLGESDDLADMVLFLASDSSSFVNGSVVHLDGGVSARSTFPDVSTYFRELHAAVVDRASASQPIRKHPCLYERRPRERRIDNRPKASRSE